MTHLLKARVSKKLWTWAKTTHWLTSIFGEILSGCQYPVSPSTFTHWFWRQILAFIIRASLFWSNGDYFPIPFTYFFGDYPSFSFIYLIIYLYQSRLWDLYYILWLESKDFCFYFVLLCLSCFLHDHWNSFQMASCFIFLYFLMLWGYISPSPPLTSDTSARLLSHCWSELFINQDPVRLLLLGSLLLLLDSERKYVSVTLWLHIRLYLFLYAFMRILN
jgi:hypothetical protein